MKDWTLGEIEINALRTVWSDVEPLLAEACSYSNGAYTPKGVVDEMAEGRFRMIALADDHVRAIMVVCVEKYPGLNVLLCVLASGENLKDWIPYEQDLDDFGRTYGCARVRMIGRKGLAKMLPHWRLTAIMLEREIA